LIRIMPALLREWASALLCGSVLVTLASAALDAGSGQSETTPTRGLSLTAKLASERYCAADDELFTYRVEIAVTVRNQTGHQIVIPRSAQAISRVFLAKDSEGLRKGKLETNLNLTAIFSGGSSLTPSSFVEVSDGASHQFPGTVTMAIPVAVARGRPRSFPSGGPFEMSFVLDLWTGTDEDENAWRQRFRRRLWTESIVSQPLHVVIPDHPRLAQCN
jgi:hypothetical protein